MILVSENGKDLLQVLVSCHTLGFHYVTETSGRWGSKVEVIAKWRLDEKSEGIFVSGLEPWGLL